MSVYVKNEWIDHIEDIESGEIIQEGTLYCARLMNHIEKGIEDAHLELIDFNNKVLSLETKVKVLEDNLINNMPHNNFYEDFSSVGYVRIIEGMYNPTFRKIYA